MRVRSVVVVLVALVLILPPFGCSSAAPAPSPQPLDHVQDGAANNTTVNATLDAVIPPRVGSSGSRGHGLGSWGDLSKANTTDGDWTKKVGLDGELYLEYDDNGTVHKLTVSLVGFKGSTKVDKPPKTVNSTASYISKEPVYNVTNKSKVDYYMNVTKFKEERVPSNSTIYGYIGVVPVTVRWTAYPLMLKEEVIWNSTSLKDVAYEVKIQSDNMTINESTLEFEYDGYPAGVSFPIPTMDESSGVPMDFNVSWSVERDEVKESEDKDKSKHWWFNVTWSYPSGAKYPFVLDPTVSFDGSTFTISDPLTEIKTYQQLWSIRLGASSVTYDSGYMKAAGDGSNAAVAVHKALSPSLNLIDLSDFTVSLDTDNADASWTFFIYFSSTGNMNGYRRYYKTFSGDILGTYTMVGSGFGGPQDYGTVDMTAINYMSITFADIDTAKGGGVDCKSKDFKLTLPVYDDDLYDSSGHAILYDEDFEGDDGLAGDSYNPDEITVVKGGSSYASIDDDQTLEGNSALKIHYDGGTEAKVDVDFNDVVDLGRNRFVLRPSGVVTNLWIEWYAGVTMVIQWIVNSSGLIEIRYGNGSGGINTVTVAYSAWTNMEFWVDLDATNNKYRGWVDSIMYPGPNADARGFDNLCWDTTASSLTKVHFGQSGAVGDFWVDGMKSYAGFEDFSALTSPHSIDDISEATSPTNTDYGRQTWDGDWSRAYGDSGTPSADNTDLIIGSNSIYISGDVRAVAKDYQLRYTFDSTIDASLYSHLRFYFKLDNKVDLTYIRCYVATATNQPYKVIDNLLIEDKWCYLDLELSTFSGGTVGDCDIISFHLQYSSVQTITIHVDGLHFYGDPNAGLCLQANSFDLNSQHLKITDCPLYDVFQIVDSGGSHVGDFTMVKETPTATARLEFSDIANAGFYHNPDYFDGITLNGYGPSNRLYITSAGGQQPTNHWWHFYTNAPTTADYRYLWIEESGNIFMGTGFTGTMEGIWFTRNLQYEHDFGTIHWSNCTIDNNVLIVYASLFTGDNFAIVNRSGNTMKIYGDGIARFTNSSFDFSGVSKQEGATGYVVSKDHDYSGQLDWLLFCAEAAIDISTIPNAYQWRDGSNAYVYAGTLDIDEATTLTNGSFSKAGTVTVNIETGQNLTMLNSVHDPIDLAIAGTGLLLDRNFTVAPYSIDGLTVTFTPSNSSSRFSWTPIWLYTGSSGTRSRTTWRTDWGDGSVNALLSYTYSQAGARTVRVGSWLDPNWTWTPVLVKTSVSSGGGGANHRDVDFEVHESFWGLHFVPRLSVREVPTGYTWYFGDGHMSWSKTPTHYYRSPGNYTVTLKVAFERGGERQVSRDVEVGDNSLLSQVAHSVELREEGLFMWLGEDTIVWPEIGLFLSGIALVAHAYLQGEEAQRLRRRGIPDRLRGWRRLQYVAGGAMIAAVLWIELAIKAGMVV